MTVIRNLITLWFLGSTGVVFGQGGIPANINDSTDARYRYELKEYLYAEVPSGTLISDIDIRERDQLKPRFSHSINCIGVNGSMEQYFQLEYEELTKIEDWMETPKIQLLTPTASYGYDSNGQLMYQYDANAANQNERHRETNVYYSEGFQPVMLFFPSKHDPYLQELVDGGALMNINPDNSFSISVGQNQMTIDPNEKSIKQQFSRANVQVDMETRYSLLAPYGYVPSLEIKRSKNLSFASPITQVSVQIFSNHVIEDVTGVIDKYTDLAHLEVFPNPVEHDFEILMRGIPNAQVSQVQIRDYSGNIIQTHWQPNVQQDLIELDASNYPIGPLIILVYTQEGVYTELITKI